MHQNNKTSQDEEQDHEIPSEQADNNSEVYKELLTYSSLETVVLAGITALAVASSFFLFSNNISLIPTPYQLFVYMCAMMIAPSAFFLIILHLYSIYQTWNEFNKPFILPLDLSYFFYVGIAASTMFFLYNYYIHNNIATSLFSPGWTLGALLILIEIPLAFLLARFCLLKKAASAFPHLYPSPAKNILDRPQQEQSVEKTKPQLYYIKQQPVPSPQKIQPDKLAWKEHPSFVQYTYQNKKYRYPKP